MTPKNLDECTLTLNEMLCQEDRDYIKLHGPLGLHHYLGRWIRNNWGLWAEDSILFEYFKELGIFHADDMSGIILDFYYCYLNQTKFDLEKEIKAYQAYWMDQK